MRKKEEEATDWQSRGGKRWRCSAENCVLDIHPAARMVAERPIYFRLCLCANCVFPLGVWLCEIKGKAAFVMLVHHAATACTLCSSIGSKSSSCNFFLLINEVSSLCVSRNWLVFFHSYTGAEWKITAILVVCMIKLNKIASINWNFDRLFNPCQSALPLRMCLLIWIFIYIFLAGVGMWSWARERKRLDNS